jgi:hypothetical protein
MRPRNAAAAFYRPASAQRQGLQLHCSPQPQAAACTGDSVVGEAWQPQLQPWAQPWHPQFVFKSFMCVLLM